MILVSSLLPSLFPNSSLNPPSFNQAVRSAHLVVEEDPDNGRHHTHDVGEGDRVAQHQQRDADDHDPLGGVGDGVAERADDVQHAEGDDVLSEVAKSADEQKDKGPRPF